MIKHMIKILATCFLVSSCGDDGANGVNGLGGSQGLAGPDGSGGSNGANGLNSLIALTRGPVDNAICPSEAGVLIQSGLDSNQNAILENSEVSQSAFLCDGLVGAQGPTPQYGISEIIDPCGDSPGVIDEILLRLGNGQLIASFSDTVGGLNTRFAIIPPGSYVNTDGSNCHFTVNANNTVTW